MPELPEVEVVRAGLADHVVGREIAQAHVRGHRVTRRHDAGPLDFTERLASTRVLDARRRGKYAWLVVQQAGDDPVALVVHLGMSGQMLVVPENAPVQPHRHAWFDFVDGGPQLRFVDQRTFGGLFLAELVPDPWVPESGASSLVPQTLLHVAPDPLEAAYDQARVIKRLRSRDSEIKRALLDQSLVSGIGNIYADEALWLAKVHGARAARSLTRPKLATVLDSAADVMRSALGHGGTSFDALYVNVNGASGYFDRSLEVYGREGLPCRRCGSLIRRESFMNRSSHFCPRCQRPPARR